MVHKVSTSPAELQTYTSKICYVFWTERAYSVYLKQVAGYLKYSCAQSLSIIQSGL